MNDLKRIKILVVDDETDLCDLIASIFNQFGFDARSAYSVDEAIKVLQTDIFSLVITDVHMPLKDGFYLLDWVKKRDSEFPRIMFISGKLVDRETAYSRGIEGFFQKPCNFDSVSAVIRQSLLQKNDRWALSTKERLDTVNKKFYDWKELESSQDIAFGRGGIFWAQIPEKCQVGDRFNFKISFNSGHPIRVFSGQAEVRWIRDQNKQDLKNGVGLEIFYLEYHSRKFYIQYLEQNNPIAFIPIA